MTQARRWSVHRAIAALALAASSSISVAAQPTPSAAQGAAVEAAPRRDRFVDTVWVVVASSGVAPGSLYVFLSTNVLVISSPGSTPAFGTWSTSKGGLVMTEEGRAYPVEIVESTTDRFRIRITNPGRPTDITFAPAGNLSGPGDPGPGAISPMPTSHVCGGETYRLAFESGMAYVTLPDGTTVELPRLEQQARTTTRTYTNGRLTFVDRTDGTQPAVSFARGRMAMTACTKAP
jgi:hypothetical protein